MQGTETVSNTSCCQIVSIAEFGNRRTDKADRMEKWLEDKIIEEYGHEDAVHNPLIRIITKFLALTEDGQRQLFRYAEDRFGSDTLDRQLWNMLERQPETMDQRTGWGMVENRADTLLQKQFEKVKKAGGMAL